MEGADTAEMGYWRDFAKSEVFLREGRVMEKRFHAC